MSKIYDESDDDQDQSNHDYNYRLNIFNGTVESKTFLDMKEQSNKINSVKEKEVILFKD